MYSNQNNQYMNRDRIVKKLCVETKPVLHTWMPRGHCEYDMSDGKFEDLEIVGGNRPLVTSNSMIPCPHETAYNGECPLRWDSEHAKYNYHFATLTSDGKVERNESYSPMCLYYLSGNGQQCWEKNSRGHRQIFAHYH